VGRGLIRWPAWSAYAAAGWSLLYGGLALYWTAGGAGFPFAPIDDDHRSGSVLEGTDVAIVAPIMAAVALAGAAVAVMMASGARRATPLIVFGWVMAAGLVLVIPDYTLLALVAFAPLLLVFAFTGVPGDQGGIGDILYWHRTNLIILFVEDTFMTIWVWVKGLDDKHARDIRRITPRLQQKSHAVSLGVEDQLGPHQRSPRERKSLPQATRQRGHARATGTRRRPQ